MYVVVAVLITTVTVRICSAWIVTVGDWTAGSPVADPVARSTIGVLESRPAWVGGTVAVHVAASSLFMLPRLAHAGVKVGATLTFMSSTCVI
jgi:hypothetical protein